MRDRVGRLAARRIKLRYVDAAPAARGLTRRGAQRCRVRLRDHAAHRLPRSAENVRRAPPRDGRLPRVCRVVCAAVPDLVAALPLLPPLRPRGRPRHRAHRLAPVRRPVFRVPAEVSLVPPVHRVVGTGHRDRHDQARSGSDALLRVQRGRRGQLRRARGAVSPRVRLQDVAPADAGRSPERARGHLPQPWDRRNRSALDRARRDPRPHGRRGISARQAGCTPESASASGCSAAIRNASEKSSRARRRRCRSEPFRSSLE